MCTTLNLPDGKHVSGIDELDAAIGRLAPILDGYHHEKWGDRVTCLCPVDMDALGKLMGWSIVSGDFDPMELEASIAAEWQAGRHA